MRVLLESYGNVRIFYDRIFGYKRYYVQWPDNEESVFSGLWYSEKRIKELVIKRIQDADL